MQYLLGQMLACLLVAGLLGLVIGWIWWGMRLRQARERASDLEQKVSKLNGYPARLTDLEATHAAYVASKNEEEAKTKARIAELAVAAAKVPDLEKSLAAKNALIAEHEAAHSDKDARLATLTGRVAEAQMAAQRVPQLEKQVDYHADANKEKDEHIEQLLTQVDDLKAKLDEKEDHFGALLSRVDELQPLVANHADLHEHLENTMYEHNLTARKLQMAEAGLLAHQAEIAKLHDQLLQHNAPPLKAMAAAAGAGFAAAAVSHFYDANEGNGKGEVSETAKRIEELIKKVAAKDEEIAELKSKIADFETAPDPDSKRQILLTAKTAELANLKGVVNTLLQPVNHDEIAKRAYFHAQQRGFHGGSPTEDWFRAERDVHYARLAHVWESTRGGTMY